MGAVFDWLTSNTHIAYPFKIEQLDESHKLFVDAWINHNRELDKEQSIVLSDFDPDGTVTLTFEDATLLCALTPADAFQTSVFGSFTIYEWTRNTTIGPGYTDEQISVKLVVLTEELSNFSYPLSPTDGTILDSLFNSMVKRVQRIGVALPDLPCCIGGGFVGNKVIFEAGNNMEINLAEDVATTDLGILTEAEARPKTRIVFDVIPGSGTGQFIDCDVTVPPPIKLINKVGPNDRGGFRLDGEACTWVERVVSDTFPPVNPFTDFKATVYEALLKLHQDCKACCDCDDYRDAYAMMTRVWNELLRLAALLEAYRKRYNELVAYLNAQREAREEEKEALNIDQVQVVLQMTCRPNFNIGISVTVFNNGDNDLALTTLIIVVNNVDFIYVNGTGSLDAPFNRGVQLDPLVSLTPFVDPQPDPPALPPGDTFTISIPQIKKGQFAAYSLNVRANSEKYFPEGLTPEQLAQIGSPQITVYAIVRSGTLDVWEIAKDAILPPLTLS